MSANSSLADKTISHAVTLERLKPAEVNEVLRQLRRLERNLVTLLTKSHLTTFRQDRYTKLLEQSRKTIRSAYRGIRDYEQDRMETVAELESRWTVNSLNAVIAEPIGISINLASVSWSPQQITAIASNALIDSSPAKTWWAKQATSMQQTFSDTVKQGLLRGAPTPEIVRELIGTKARNYEDGAFQMSRNQATTLVRSSISATAADARTATYEENKDLISSVAWHSTLDTRTTLEFCIPRDGKRYTLEEHLPIGHDLPWGGGPGKIHFNCRSTVIAVLKSWSELAGRTLPDADDKTIDQTFRENLRNMGWSEERIAGAQRRTRSSMDGQVPSSTDFQSWLSTKGAAFQDEVLGKGKAELYRAGKVTGLSQLLDFRGNPLTLKQLRGQ